MARVSAVVYLRLVSPTFKNDQDWSSPPAQMKKGRALFHAGFNFSRPAVFIDRLTCRAGPGVRKLLATGMRVQATDWRSTRGSQAVCRI